MHSTVTFWLVALLAGFGFSFLTFLAMSHKDGQRISKLYWLFIIATVIFIGVMLNMLSSLRCTYAC